jgi:hypothetical protein
LACEGECGLGIHQNCLGDDGSEGSPGLQAWFCNSCKPVTSGNSEPSAMVSAPLQFTTWEAVIWVAERFSALQQSVAAHREHCDTEMALIGQVLKDCVNAGEPGMNNNSNTYAVATSPPRHAVAAWPSLPPPGSEAQNGNAGLQRMAAIPRDEPPAAAPAQTPILPTQPNAVPRAVASTSATPTPAKNTPRTSEPTTQKQNNYQKQKKTTTSDIFVKSKEDQNKNKQQALEEVKKHLPPTTIKDHIEDVTGLPGTGSVVVVKCTNSASRIVVEQALTKAIGDAYQIEKSQPRVLKSKIKVLDVNDEDLSADPEGNVDLDQLLNKIKEKNNIPADGLIRILQAKKSTKKHRSAMLIILVDETTKNFIIKNGLKVGYSRLQVQDLGCVRTCFKCGGYNHSQWNCTRPETTCYVCAETGHHGKECDQWKNKTSHKCPNCVKYNTKYEGDAEFQPLDVNHKAGDQNNCEIYKRVDSRVRLQFEKE